jgi:hypothetical protein
MNTKRIANPVNSPTGWIGSQEAASILSKKYGRTISDAYVRRLSGMGKITVKEGKGRANLYWKADVESCNIKPQDSGEVRRAIREKREAKERMEA